MRSKCRCSMCPAIHINSRSWLRSSSTHEPSDPPPKVVSFFFVSKRSRVLLRPRKRHARLSRSRPIEKLAKMKRLRNKQKQKKPGGGTRPRGRRDSLNLRRRTGRPLQKKKKKKETRASFPTLLRRRERERAGRPFPSASLCRKCRRLLLPWREREESPTSRASQVPHSHSFSGGGRAEAKPGQTLRTSTLGHRFTDDCGSPR